MPLLAGWNAGEVRSSVTLRPQKPTAESFKAELAKRFGASADAIGKAYGGATDAEALEAAAALASDSFISYGTWKWLEVHRATGGAKVYRYLFERDIPIEPGRMQNGTPVTARDVGARHAGEIEYVFGMLDTIKNVTWAPEDRALSNAMMEYWSSFAKTGSPKASGQPAWPAFDKAGGPVMFLGDKVRVAPEAHRDRYEAFDAREDRRDGPGCGGAQPPVVARSHHAGRGCGRVRCPRRAADHRLHPARAGRLRVELAAGPLVTGHR